MRVAWVRVALVRHPCSTGSMTNSPSRLFPTRLRQRIEHNSQPITITTTSCDVCTLYVCLYVCMMYVCTCTTYNSSSVPVKDIVVCVAELVEEAPEQLPEVGIVWLVFKLERATKVQIGHKFTYRGRRQGVTGGCFVTLGDTGNWQVQGKLLHQMDSTGGALLIAKIVLSTVTMIRCHWLHLTDKQRGRAVSCQYKQSLTSCVSNTCTYTTTLPGLNSLEMHILVKHVSAMYFEAIGSTPSHIKVCWGEHWYMYQGFPQKKIQAGCLFSNERCREVYL